LEISQERLKDCKRDTLARGQAKTVMSDSTINLPSGHIFRFEDSNWVSVYKDDATVTATDRPHMFWILLQYSLAELSSMAAQACVDASIPAEQCPPLPIEDIIRGGLTSNSGEWQMLALARAAEFDNKRVLETEISQLVTSGKTQAVRHFALKLRAHLRRSND
jgi:hypothetical protein